MRIKGRHEWVEIDKTKTLFIAINIEKIDEKDICEYAKRHFNVDVKQVFGSTTIDCRYLIWEFNSKNGLSVDCLNGIEDYVFELK